MSRFLVSFSGPLGVFGLYHMGFCRKSPRSRKGIVPRSCTRVQCRKAAGARVCSVRMFIKDTTTKGTKDTKLFQFFVNSVSFVVELIGEENGIGKKTG